MMIGRPYLHNLIPLAIIVPLRDSLMDDDTKRKTCITIKDVPCKQEIIKENMNQSPKGDRICTSLVPPCKQGASTHTHT